MTGETGTVYLLHLNEPFGHAQHYLGWARNLDARLEHHRRGTGANLLRHAKKAGCDWVLARTWPDSTRSDERRLHSGGHSRRCPVCKESNKEKAA